MKISAHRHAPLLAGLVVFLGLASAILARAPLPAGLAVGHAALPELARLTGCAQCHSEEGLDAGCLGCHDEIAAQFARGEGYHAYLRETADGGRCTGCHLEHYGDRFEVAGEVAWRDLGRDGFAHPHVEFALAGAHDRLECEGCHEPELAPAVHTGEFPELVRARTFLGLAQECTRCHEDVHAGGLSPVCTECHDQEAFRPAPLFDHDEHFALGCAHERVECRLCHVIPEAAANGLAEKRSLPFAEVRGVECLECHESPHRAEFSADCFECHRKDACLWRDGRERMTAALHRETGFPLEAPHAEVRCEECHSDLPGYPERYPDPALPGYRRAPQSCEGCHEDEHRGQFAGRFARCRDCHSAQRFVPAEFGIADHGVWPLDGAHRAVGCNECHVIPAGSDHRRYAGLAKECASCHRDPHLAQFQESRGGMDCTRCHTSPDEWSAGGFDHDRDSRFTLAGDHREVPCAECHASSVLPDGHTVVHYRPLGRECQDCHERPMR